MPVSDEPFPSAAYAWYVVAILAVAYTFSFIDRQILNLLVEPIKYDLKLSDTQISLLQGIAFALFYTILGIPIARLADIGNRRLIIAIGVFIWSLMTAACGLARTFLWLFSARVGVGVGEAALSPSAYSIISDYFPADKVTRAIAVYTGGSFVGAGLAYIIGGLVVDVVTSLGTVDIAVLGRIHAWQVAFIVVGLPGLLLALVILSLREPARKGLVANSGGRYQSVPISEVIRFLRSNWQTFACHFGGFSVIVLLSYAILAWTPTVFIRVHGWTAGQIGVVFGAIILVCGTSGVVSAGWLCDWLRHRGYADANLRLISIGAICLVPFGLAALLVADEWLALLLMVPLTFLWSLPHGVGPAALQPITPNQMRAQISALYLFTINLIGLGLGPISVALFTDYVYGDPSFVHYSLATVIGAAAPVSALVLGIGCKYYRQSLARAEDTRERET